MSGSFLVDFDQPIPLFPLVGVALFPQTVQPLHIFEPRYRQMIEDCMAHTVDGDLSKSGPIALAVLEKGVVGTDSVGSPPLKPIVCIGRILKNHLLPDGRRNILLHGVCRALIRSVDEPDDDRLYRVGDLRPIESPLAEGPSPVVREALKRLLHGDQLNRMHAAEAVREWVDQEEVPIETLIEMASFVLVKDEHLRYQLLQEPDPSERARIVYGELHHIDRLVARCDQQGWREWPKGLSWN